MKITILGAGSAYGTPMILNAWGKTNKDNPKNRRTRASILIEDKGQKILVDAGPDLREQINRENVTDINAVFITHGHYDHIAGIPELPRATKLLGHSIDVFASAETMTELKTCYGYLFKEKADAEPDSKSIKWKLLPDDGIFDVSGLTFETSQLPHHHLHSSLFRYQNFAYVTDWQEMLPTAKSHLENLDMLLIECNNGTSAEENGHSDIFKIRNLLAEINPKHVILTHLSTRIDYDDFAKELPENCKLAYDGLVVNI